MRKFLIKIIVLAIIFIGALFIYEMRKNTDDCSEDPSLNYVTCSPVVDDKKLPGDSMTEKAVENALQGKQKMDEESLPNNNAPKANNLQGGSGQNGEFQSGVILEGSANDLKVQD